MQQLKSNKLLLIPNAITILRIVGAISLVFIPIATLPFYILFAISGVSDIVDGYIARKYHLESEVGSKLDSLADLLFYGITIAKHLSLMIKVFSLFLWAVLITDIIIRIVIYVFAVIKYKRFASIHTYLNKLSGLYLFFLPFFAATNFFLYYGYIGAGLAFVAATEELAIHILSKEYTDSHKTILNLKKAK